MKTKKSEITVLFRTGERSKCIQNGATLPPDDNRIIGRLCVADHSVQRYQKHDILTSTARKPRGYSSARRHFKCIDTGSGQNVHGVRMFVCGHYPSSPPRLQSRSPQKWYRTPGFVTGARRPCAPQCRSVRLLQFTAPGRTEGCCGRAPHRLINFLTQMALGIS